MKNSFFLLILILILSSCSNSSFTSRRFARSFYVKQNKLEVVQEPKQQTSQARTILSEEELSKKIDSVVSVPSDLVPTTSPYAPAYRIIPAPSDTIPPKEEEEDEKLNRKEKFSFAMVITGTVFLMLGFGLAAYVLILILQGTTVYASIWYFIGALVLVGFLLREWGVLMKT